MIMGYVVMKRILLILLIALLCFSCGDKHLITDNNYREKVEKRFNERKDFAASRSEKLFGVFDQNLSTEEKEALQFLYAYMPLCDLADYNGEFFLQLVKYSLKARDTFKWGKDVPEEIFRHFVLPYRVNNENLDSARVVFFKELKERIINMDIEEAALEVNHWCHEKVTYKPSDIRTSAPLSTVKSTRGRCGEESTFTVTALRAVGIPARQVYTPRWAHCDDNHAWVEVWINGTWKYLGACEPEPKLNMGWFTEPARRAMLVHTKVFGDYDGTDEVVNSSENFTEINVISNYAETKKIFVKVIDGNGNASDNVKVDFGLYNYAEFYPIASKHTSNEGLTFLTTGLGDLLIWASKDNLYASEKISVAETDTLILQLQQHTDKSFTVDYDLYPPIEQTPITIDEKLREENNKRLKEEDVIRENYRATFIDSSEAVQFADQVGLDRVNTWKYLKMSEGNWREIQKFMETTDSQNRGLIFPMLNVISEKDLRDTKAEILNGHLKNTAEHFQPSDYRSKEMFFEYVLNPRIKNESLIPYRKGLHEIFDEYLSNDRVETVNHLVSWIKKNILINEKENYYNLPVTPIGVYELKISNKESRNIFVVAVCRSIGIPARLEPSMKTPQFFNGIEWLNILFEQEIKAQPESGYLSFKADNSWGSTEPKYWLNFTYGKLENGAFKTADYDDIIALSNMPAIIKVETGYYRVITGNRNSDGKVFSHVSYFTIDKDKQTVVTLSQRKVKNDAVVLGRVELKDKLNEGEKAREIKDLFTKDFLVIGWIEPDKEPTKHVLNDFKDLKGVFEKWGGNLVFVVPSAKKTASFNGELLKGLPANVKFMDDINDQLLSKVESELKIKETLSYPVITVINKSGEIIYSSAGYKIGVGEQLIKTVM